MSDAGFVGEIPDIYDDYLVPLIFETYAADMARRVADAGATDVLEIAAGSGVVTRALAQALGPGARLTVTDLNQPMLDRAKRRQPDAGHVTWQAADALDLPFPDGSFHAVACQFGVMFFPDRVKGHVEARRVLREDGIYVFNVWDRIGVNLFAEVVTQAVSALFGGKPTQFMARVPHGYHDKAQIAADLRSAGFTDFDIDTIPAHSVAATPEIPAIAYCQGTPLRNEIEAIDPSRLEEATDAAARAIRDRFGEGQVSGLIQAHVVVARR